MAIKSSLAYPLSRSAYETSLGPLLVGAGKNLCFLTGGVSNPEYNTPSVFAFGESTSLKEGGKGTAQTR